MPIEVLHSSAYVGDSYGFYFGGDNSSMVIDRVKNSIDLFLLLRGRPFVDESSTAIDSARRLLSIKDVSTVVDSACEEPAWSSTVIDRSGRWFSRFR